MVLGKATTAVVADISKLVSSSSNSMYVNYFKHFFTKILFTFLQAVKLITSSAKGSSKSSLLPGH